jgi:ATP-binding cassette, subfamily C (CFTR/MRP), member 1
MSNHSFLFICAAHNKWLICKGIIPRLFQMGFTLAQPFLVKRVVSYIQGHEFARTRGFDIGLIMAYTIVYIGIAISTAMAQYRTFQLVTRVRAGLLDAIYRHTLEIRSTSAEEADAITLIGPDVERIATGLRLLHELWASLAEIILVIWFLERELGLAILGLAGVILICTASAFLVAAHASGAQKLWLDKIQLRLTSITAMLKSMKAVRMTGLADILAKSIHALREDEIKASFGFRIVLLKIVVLSFFSLCMSLVAALGLYILLQESKGYANFDTTKALTILSQFQLLITPLSLLMDSLRDFIAVLGCFQRIENYLDEKIRVDSRTPDKPDRNLGPQGQTQEDHRGISAVSHYSGSADRVIPSSPILPDGEGHVSTALYADYTITFRNVAVGWRKDKPPILRDMDVDIPLGKLTMVIGPVGCGKSTFLHTLLGETLLFDGSIASNTSDIAFCSQSAWLSDTTVQRNIIGPLPLDIVWYYAVIHACALVPDIEQLSQGDQTVVGSNGTALSGGQQMRVALARAIYSRKKIVVLDDIFSSIDGTTVRNIFLSLLAHNGLLKRHKITVVLATNSLHLVAESDFIIALGQDGHIAQQGPFKDLYQGGGYISNFNTTPQTENLPQTPDWHPDLFALESAPKFPQCNTTDATIGDIATYKYYIECFGWTSWWVFISLCATFGFLSVFPQPWISWWASHNMEHPLDKADYYWSLYCFLGLMTVISLGAAAT